jgi:hypothetical protein
LSGRADYPILAVIKFPFLSMYSREISRYKTFAVLVFLSLSLFSSSCSHHRLRNVKIDESAQRFSSTYTNQIEGAQKFAEAFFKEYKKKIYPLINRRFWDSVPYTQQLDAELDISHSAESLLLFAPSDEDNLVVKATNLPIQYALIRQLDIFGDHLLNVTIPDTFMKQYYKMAGCFEVGFSSSLALVDVKVSHFYRFITFEDAASIVALRNLKYNPRYDDNRTGTIQLGFLISGANFSNNIDDAAGLADLIAPRDAKELFFRSEYFREVMAYDSLADFAKMMQTKFEKSIRSEGYAYTQADFDNDYQILQAKIRHFHLDDKFEDKLLKDVKDRLKPGTLLWLYFDYYSFSVQWTIVNLFLGLTLAILIFARRQWNFTFIQQHLVASAVIIVLNMWAFKSKPADMPINYWIIPGILFFIVWGLAIKYYKALLPTTRNSTP